MTIVHDIVGTPITMPVRVREASAATVMYDVSADAVRALLPDGFVPVERAPGRTDFALALIDYRDNDLGAYLEIGTIFFVIPAEGGDAGNLITHLPVSEQFTCVAGNQIWGFPKSVEDIEVTYADDSSRWVLRMDGKLVLDVTVPRGGSDFMAPMTMTTYTVIDGVRHATAFTQGGSGSGLFFDAEVTLTLGSHPLSKELASLGLADAPVTLTTWLEHMEGSFEQPRPV